MFSCRFSLWEGGKDDLERGEQQQLCPQAEAEEERPPLRPQPGQGFPSGLSAGGFPNAALGDLPDGAELSLR